MTKLQEAMPSLGKVLYLPHRQEHCVIISPKRGRNTLNADSAEQDAMQLMNRNARDGI